MRLEDYWTRVILLELVGYREWTESLGSSREWLIQDTQATVYRELQRASWRLGYFTIPARYDYIIVLAPNATEEGAREILEAAKSTAPTPVKAASVCAETPRDSERESYKLLRETQTGRIELRECPNPEAIAVAHIDFNNITEITRKTSPLESLEFYEELHSRIKSLARRHGGITAYLGGDNTLVAIAPKSIEPLRAQLAEMREIKAGIGVAKTARRAIELATRALDDTRQKPDRETIVLASLE